MLVFKYKSPLTYEKEEIISYYNISLDLKVYHIPNYLLIGNTTNINTFLAERNILRHNQTVLRKYPSILHVQLHQQTQINHVISPPLCTVARRTETELIDNNDNPTLLLDCVHSALGTATATANEKVDSSLILILSVPTMVDTLPTSAR